MPRSQSGVETRLFRGSSVVRRARAVLALTLVLSAGCEGVALAPTDESSASEEFRARRRRARQDAGTTTDGSVTTDAAPTPTPTPEPTPAPTPTPTPEPSPTESSPPPDSGGSMSTGDFAVNVDMRANGEIALAWSMIPDAASVRVTFGSEPANAGALPGPTSQVDLAGGATGHVISGIAPGTTLFVQVSASTPSGARVGSAAVRTRSGFEVNGPLTHVYSYGRDVLLIELRDSSINVSDAQTRGSRWAGGTWRVARSDGRTIGVSGVKRRTQVIGQPNYPVGFNQWGDGNIVDVSHSIFLTLSEPIGTRELLRVEHVDGSTTDVSTTVPFSDSFMETPLIQVNQVGYNPRATRRWAYVSGYMGDGGPVDVSRLPTTADVLVSNDGLSPRLPVVSGLAVTSRASNDTQSGGAVSEIDLSRVPADEAREYRVRLPGVGVSFRTAVSERAVFDAYYTVLRGMFHNRWCGDLGAAYTDWSRPADHCTAYFVTGKHYEDGMFDEAQARTDERPLIGGHHDAGDFDIRPFHVLVGQYLMRAVELGGDRLTDSQLRLPESGNGIPDMLDEALWSIEGWLALQNSDGSVRAGVESWREPAGIYFSDADELPYFTYEPEPWHTAYVAALFAQAARLVRPYDSARASRYETAARNAYGSSVAQSAPTSYRLFAASELTALTGEARFKSDFESYWRALDRYGSGAFDSYDEMIDIYPGSFVEHTPVMADFVMGYAQSAVADPAIVGVITSSIRSRADAAAGNVLESAHAHRNGTGESDWPDWGRLASTGRHLDAIYQALALGGLPADVKQRYIDATSVAADYTLGTNPIGTSYITGLGTRSPRQVLHNDSLSWLAMGRQPVPGIPVYGPVSSIPGPSYYEPFRVGFYPTVDQLPVGLRYVDSRTAVTTSEFTVWENQAPTAELFAALFAAR